MAELHCRHLKLPGEPGFWCFRLDEQGVVRDVRPEPSHAVEGRQQHHWDWQGDWLSPAAVDLQINGLQGLWFGHLEAGQLDPLRQALVWLRQQGVDAVCPTLITGPLARLRQSLALLRRVRQQQGGAEARLLGAHLEGPFLAVNKRGAHPRRHVQPLTLGRLKQLMDGFSAEDVALVTMAPELDPRHEALDWLVEQGIVVSLGHTEVNQTQATAAFTAGARLLTTRSTPCLPCTTGLQDPLPPPPWPPSRCSWGLLRMVSMLPRPWLYCSPAWPPAGWCL